MLSDMAFVDRYSLRRQMMDEQSQSEIAILMNQLQRIFGKRRVSESASHT